MPKVNDAQTFESLQWGTSGTDDIISNVVK